MITSFTKLHKIFSPGVMAKALTTFDRLTLLIVSICWAVTLVVIFVAIYTIHLSVDAKTATETALATEPNLPKITRNGVGGKELQTVLDRLKNEYPNLAISWQKDVLTIAAANGSLYHQWLTAIGQVDTIYPQFHWSIQDMCIGSECNGQYLMWVDLAGQKVSLEMPQ